MSSYDQKLLEEAPKATRAQLQEGYNVDLLEPQAPRRTPSTRNPPSQLPQPPPITVPLTTDPADTGSGEKLGSTAHTPAAPRSQTSFWRSRNGIIAITLIALIVIGAVVGGAVGGTAKKANKLTTTGTSAGSSVSGITAVPTTTAAGNQGVGGVNTKGASSTSQNLPTSTQKQNNGGQVVGS